MRWEIHARKVCREHFEASLSLRSIAENFPVSELRYLENAAECSQSSAGEIKLRKSYPHDDCIILTIELARLYILHNNQQNQNALKKVGKWVTTDAAVLT